MSRSVLQVFESLIHNNFGGTSKPDNVLWDKVSRNQYRMTHSVTWSCVVCCVCPGVRSPCEVFNCLARRVAVSCSITRRRDWQPQPDVDCGRVELVTTFRLSLCGRKRKEIKRSLSLATSTLVDSCTLVSLMMNEKHFVFAAALDLIVASLITSNQSGPTEKLFVSAEGKKQILISLFVMTINQG